MKHFKQFLLVVQVALTSSVTVSAYDFEVDGVFYNVLDLHNSPTCEVAEGPNKYSGDIKIPSSVTYSTKTFAVTKIGQRAFYMCDNLTSIELPNSLTLIDWEAFVGCLNLKSLVIPNSVTEIKEDVLKGCSKLEEVTLSNNLTQISERAFHDCSSLKSVHIPDKITDICNQAFQGCKSLETINLHNGIRNIGSSAFAQCESLSSIELPCYITIINDGAFFGCTNLSSIKIPQGVSFIGMDAFAGSKISTLTIPNSVNEISSFAFSGCMNLKEIVALCTTPPSITEVTFNGINKAECIVRVLEDAVDEYKSAYEWKTFWNIVGVDEMLGDNQQIMKCNSPTLELFDGKIMAQSSTEGSKCYTSITTEDYKGYDGNEPISFTGIYKITSYAHAEGYFNSETVEATLVWVNPTLEGSNIINMEAKKAILIRSNGNCLQISGTERGERIELYTVGGVLLNSVSAKDDGTIIPCNLQKGEVVIINYGDKSIKCKL